MKLWTAASVLCAVASCGGDTQPLTGLQSDIGASSPYMTWRVSANCPAPAPTFMLYEKLSNDKLSGQKWGPYFISAPISKPMEITITCIPGNDICYGAWKGDGPYWDDEKQTTVIWNEAYWNWGCGKDCQDIWKSLPLTCHACGTTVPKNKFLRCRDD